MKYFVTTILVLLFAVDASAQLTFTASDYTQQNQKASITYSSDDLSGLSALIAKTGIGQTWNVGGRTYDAGQLNLSGVLLPYPSGAALASDPSFTTSTHVFADTTFESGSRIISYSFMRITADGAWILGASQDSAGTASKVSTFSPPFQMMKFPLSYGTSWTSTSNLIDAIGDTIQFSQDLVADAEGTLVTPLSNSHAALRTKTKMTISMSYGPYTISFSSYSYDWRTKEGYSASISADSNMNPTGVTYTDPIGAIVIAGGAAWQSGTTGDFGTVQAGSTNTMSFTVEDTSAIPITIQSVSVTGADASEFSVLTSYPQSVSAGGLHDVQVQWTPGSAAGTHTATMNVSLGEVGTLTLPLTGVVEASDVAEVSNSGFSMSVWPNPMSKSGELSIVSPVSGKVAWSLVDQLGRVQYADVQSLNAGAAAQIELPLSRLELPMGQYFLRAILNGASLTVPVVIAR